MCAVIGLSDYEPVNQKLYNGLIVLQHRGQDSAGILTSDGKKVFLRKDNGLVKDVFRERHMLRLEGNMGIGHLRYPTAGSDSRVEAQPFYVNSPFGIGLVHNGNLTNADELRAQLFRQDLRQLNTMSDSEILLNVFAHELSAVLAPKLALSSSKKKMRVERKDIFATVERVMKRCSGAYAAIVMIVGVGIVAFRDVHGIRPLIQGVFCNGQKKSHMFASESVALDVLGYDHVGDVGAGEAVFVDIKGQVSRQVCALNPVLSPCIFEYVYLARPDSVMDGISVYQTRVLMGKKLGLQIKKQWVNHDIDVVIPVPDTSRTVALEIAKVLSLSYSEGLIKNRYIGRTFIMTGQTERQNSVRQKLNPVKSEFKNKNVLLVDDSIVRGTTSRKIISLARASGAKKVYFASAAPSVRYQNVYGIDMPAKKELIAHKHSHNEICNLIGADRLIFQTLEDLISVVKSCGPHISNFDVSCFNGVYNTGDISRYYLKKVEVGRSDGSRKKAENPFYGESDSIDISGLAS